MSGLRVSRITTSGRSVTSNSSTRETAIESAVAALLTQGKVVTTDSIYTFVVKEYGMYLSRYEINEKNWEVTCRE
jgi:hypothetical protein